MANPKCAACGGKTKDADDPSPVEGTKMIKCEDEGCQSSARIFV